MLKKLKSLFKKHDGVKKGVLVAAVLVLAFLLYQNKNIFVVATVNGRPVWRWELDSRLTQQYGSSTLDELTSEDIIRQEAANRGITATPDEINQKISDIEKSLSGRMTLTDALSAQGMTMEDLRRQLELQVLMEKMINTVVVTNQEVADYVASNSATLTATDSAGKIAQARSTLENSRKSQAMQQLFSELKQKAKIEKYL